MDTERQQKSQHNKRPWLKEYQWKPGQSGNPGGGPKGKQLKTWAREFLMELPDEEKLEFLKEIPPVEVWRMAEGNADTKSSVKIDGKMENSHDEKELEEIARKMAEQLKEKKI